MRTIANFVRRAFQLLATTVILLPPAYCPSLALLGALPQERIVLIVIGIAVMRKR